MTTLDDLELELRRLPGVRSAGFQEREDLLFVQVHIADGHTEPGLALQATRLASRHTEQPVAVELVRWRNPAGAVAAPVVGAQHSAAPPTPTATVDLTAATSEPTEARVKLLAVLSFPDTDELEVHVNLGQHRKIGRAPASRGLIGAVEATLDALSAFAELAHRPGWARTIETAPDHRFVVAVGLEADDTEARYGLSVGESPVEAAARATLHALNRTVAPQLLASVVATTDG